MDIYTKIDKLKENIMNNLYASHPDGAKLLDIDMNEIIDLLQDSYAPAELSDASLGLDDYES